MFVGLVVAAAAAAAAAGTPLPAASESVEARCLAAPQRLGEEALCMPTGVEMTRSPPPTYTATFTLASPPPATGQEWVNSTFTISVDSSWAPHSASRFYNLARLGFFEQQRLYRVVPGWVVQFGASGSPEVAAVYDARRNRPGVIVVSDPVRHANSRGTVAFGASYDERGLAVNRTTELRVNLGDNAAALDPRGFAPFGMISAADMAAGLGVYVEYGELPALCGGGTANPHRPERCDGPDAGRMCAEGNAYLRQNFPLMTYVASVVVDDDGRGGGGHAADDGYGGTRDNGGAWVLATALVVLMYVCFGLCVIGGVVKVVLAVRRRLALLRGRATDPATE